MKSEVEFGDYPVRIIPLCQIPRSIVVDFPMRLSIHQQLRKSVKTIMDVIFPSDLLSVDLVSHFTQLVSVYILWKRENYWFSDFFREYRNRPAAWIGLKVNFPITEKPVNTGYFVQYNYLTQFILFLCSTLHRGVFRTSSDI